MTSPLADRTFRHLFAAQGIALFGTGLTTVALALLAYELAGGDAGLVLGTAFAIKMVAYVGIAPIVGGYAHRLPRAALLVALDCARAGTALLLPFVDAVWQIYVLIFVLNACSAGFTPVFQATIPDVLRDEARYTRALSLSRLAYDMENLLSPLCAALLLSVMSFHVLFALNGAAFLGSALLVLSTTLPRAAPSTRGRGIGQNIGYGIQAYLRTPRLRGVLVLSVAVAAAGAMIIVNTVVYVRGELGASDATLAFALAAFGMGSMTAALAVPRLLERVAERTAMLAGTGLMGIGLSLGAAQPRFWGVLVVWFVIGLGSGLVQTPMGRLLRRSCRDEDRPALFSAHFALSHLCWLGAYPAAGWLGGRAGFETAFASLALVVLAAMLAAMVFWPRNDPIEVDHSHDSLIHDHPHGHDPHHDHIHDGEPARRATDEIHSHVHTHKPVRHRHAFVIDYHHRQWP